MTEYPMTKTVTGMDGKSKICAEGAETGDLRKKDY